MIIWILAVVLFGSVGFAGYSFGAIRAGFSFAGLLTGALLAAPLGRMLRPALTSVGMTNPVLIWLMGPVIVFLGILIVFKIIGIAVHRKVDVYYKYKAGDLRMALWNRMNARLGICLAMANTAVYLTVISLPIYVLSYSTFQTMSGDQVAWYVKLLNIAGNNLQTSGMAKIAASIDPMPDVYYEAADLVGLIYHNDLLEARLSRYPAFLSLGELPEFQTIANDTAFTELRQRQPPILDIIHHSDMQAILKNPDLLSRIWDTVAPNLKDLEQFLKTGASEKYDGEKILGRWDFNVNRALGVSRQLKPNMGSLEMRRLKLAMSLIFAKTMLVATLDKNVYIKNIGKIQFAPPAAGQGGRVAKPGAAALAGVTPQVTGTENLQGQWSPDGSGYKMTIQDHGSFDAVVEGDELRITGYQYPMVFDREY
jgi:hypothetical protein